jgi:peptidoglycan/xylan/chitin deacetylase (PgdA/CDA1 family)
MRRLFCAVLVTACAGLVWAQVLSTDGAIVRGSTREKAIALVFTGHEFAEGGDAILDALAAQRARASFFLTGDFLRRPEFARFVRRIVAEGHYLGPHSDKHLLYCDWAGKKTLVTRSVFREDVEANLREIAAFGIPRPDARYFLPAYEWCNEEIVGWARDAGLVTVNFTQGTRSTLPVTLSPRKMEASSEKFSMLSDT